MKRLILLAALALAACHPPATDGYRFERKEFDHREPRIVIIVHRTVDDLRRAAPAATVREAGEQNRMLMAFSILRGGVNGVCELHVVDPAKSYQPEWMGHEFAHCIWGRWHS